MDRIRLIRECIRKSKQSSSANCNLTMRRDKSFADDLIVHRGAVSGRVALLLRSAEAKPLMPRFVPFGTLPPPIVPIRSELWNPKQAWLRLGRVLPSCCSKLEPGNVGFCPYPFYSYFFSVRTTKLTSQTKQTYVLVSLGETNPEPCGPHLFRFKTAGSLWMVFAFFSSKT